MGNTISILACSAIKDKCLNSDRLAVELCESIHLHYRDMRLEFEEPQFNQLAQTIADTYSRRAALMQQCSPDVFVELAKTTLNPLSNGDSVVKIERLANDVIHLHYRNLRIEFNRESFESVAKLFCEAFSNLSIEVLRSISANGQENQYEKVFVPLNEINPYDRSHRKHMSCNIGFQCNSKHETQDHVIGINLCMDLVTSGCRMLPIAITAIENQNHLYSESVEMHHRFQRLDGFKRYMAYRKLGITEVECHLYSGAAAYPGNQRYLPWVIP